jgi:hypothetical protein
MFRTRPDQPWGPRGRLFNGNRISFSGVKRPGRGVNQPPPYSAEVKERVKLYLYSHSGPSWRVVGRTFICRPHSRSLYKQIALPGHRTTISPSSARRLSSTRTILRVRKGDQKLLVATTRGHSSSEARSHHLQNTQGVESLQRVITCCFLS